MTRVKDAELQKLRSQVKNLENSLHRTTEVMTKRCYDYVLPFIAWLYCYPSDRVTFVAIENVVLDENSLCV
jgi:hypothetical protein